jgi:hypothetical protein
VCVWPPGRLPRQSALSITRPAPAAAAATAPQKLSKDLCFSSAQNRKLSLLFLKPIKQKCSFLESNKDSYFEIIVLTAGFGSLKNLAHNLPSY